MPSKTLIKRYGRMEAKEHHLPVRTGEKLAADHLKEFGPEYYKRLSSLEKKLKK